MMRHVLLLLLAATGVAAAAIPSDSAFDPRNFSYHQRPGAMLPYGLWFQDADDARVQLGELAHGIPMILVPAYLRCPNLCGVVRANLLNTLRYAGLAAGRDYVLVVLSIDPTDTSVDARAAKAADLAAFGGGNMLESNWHYLTGAAPDITAVTDAVGFRDRLDTKSNEFIHPAGVVFVTAGGNVSNYLLGVGYTPTAVRSALQLATVGRIAAAAAPLLLICFHFDPATGRYSLEILKVLRLAAVLTVLTIAGTLFMLHRRGAKPA